ncbi:conserved Plasmodium protein, unknown function [Plasmodium relictum]|uniref:Centrosomal protein of 70 kDa n=1 Tax=Plasmodium relictum TaxID=85471 RepID=A0A1J1HA73_PLARL|nr:conserved Plasmodium protein, unknown function [Plasmodium relictum]CRH01526.1 conserved Plasmodium protein, unknown function [Plasmodium relictum]
MSDDDFFYDKDKCSLHYIKSKTSTKIDDILKRRRAKQIKEANDLKSDTFLSFDDSLGKIENEEKKENNNDIFIDNKSGISSNNYNIYKDKDKINNDLNEYERNSYLIKDNFADSCYYTNNNISENNNLNNFSKNNCSNHNDKKNIYEDHSPNKYNTIENISENAVDNLSYNRLKRELTSYNNMEEFQNKNKALLYKKSLENIQEYSNNIVNDHNENEIKEKKEKQNIYFDELKILKTPSTELILNKIKSNDDSKDEMFTNLNKIYVNEIDMNKTPSKSFSKSYFEYLKFETAGKMNMSELETPLNLKEEDTTNTPFITYYLAGKIKNKNINGIENLENNLKDNLNEKEEINSNKEDENDYVNYYLKDSNIYGNEISKKKELKKKDDTEIEESFKDNEKSTNDNDIASITSNNKYSENHIYNKIINSKKYNFIKTEEHYKNMLKEKSSKNDNMMHSNNNKRFFNNDISFTDKNLSNAQFNIMNTKTFKMNFFNELKSKNHEDNAYLPNFKNEIKSFSFENPFNIEDKQYREISNSKKVAYGNSNEEQYDKMIENYNGKLYSTKNFEQNNHSIKNTILISSNIEKEVKENNNNNNDESHITLYKNLDKELSAKNRIIPNNLEKYKMSMGNGFVNKCNEENYVSIDIQKNINNKDNINNNQNYVYNSYKTENDINNKKYVDNENILVATDENYINKHNIYYHEDNNNRNSNNINYNTYNNSKNYAENKYYNIYKNDEYNLNKNEHNDLSKIEIHSNIKMETSKMNENIHHSNYEKGNILNTNGKDSFKMKLNMAVDKNSTNEINSMYKKFSNENVEDECVRNNNTIKNSNVDLSNDLNLKNKDSYAYKENSENNNSIIPNDNMDIDKINHNNKSVYNEGNSIYYTTSLNNKNAHNVGNMSKNIYETKANDLNNVSIYEKRIFSTSNKNITNKLGETADFGYKEVNNIYDSKDADILRMDNNNYNSDIDKINNVSDIKKSCFDYVKNNFNNVNMNDVKSMIFNSEYPNKENTRITFDTISKEINSEYFNEFIRDKIKSSINCIVEQILNDNQNNILKKLNTSIPNNEININDKYEMECNQNHHKNNNINGTEIKKCGNYNYKNEEKSINENKINLEVETKSEENFSKKYMNYEYEYWQKNDFNNINEENMLKNMNNAENFDNINLSKNLNKKKKKTSILKVKDNVDEFNEEDFHEIDKLNDNLKMSRVNRIIEISKSDLEKKKIKCKDILYSCIDVIYYLLNENNKKNNKMNNLLSEINNINEYEKKIENLAKENEKLKIVIEQRSESLKKKEIKERANLNKKITEQTKKITGYERDINIYKNKINNLSSKIMNKENEIEKLKKQYQVILEEIESCKNDANKVIKKVLNKKYMNLIDKQCFDISKYYEIQINSLNKEIKNLKDIIKSEAKEKILLNRKLNELEQINKDVKVIKNIIPLNSTNDVEIEIEKKKKKKEITEDDKLVNEEKKLKKNKIEKDINNSFIERNKEFKENEILNESKYKMKYQNLVKEMNEIKKDFEEQKKLYSKKIEQLEQNQEIQNMKNQLDTSEKIVQVYQNIFREKVNNIKSDHSYNQYCDKNKDDAENNYSCLSYNENKNYLKNSNNVNMNNNLNKSNIDDVNKFNSLFFQKEMNKINNISSNLNLTTINRDVIKNKNYLVNDNNLFNISHNENNNISDTDALTQNRYLNDFVKLYIDNFHMNDTNKNYKNDFGIFQKKSEQLLNNSKNNFINKGDNDFLYKNLMNYEKVELIKIFVSICNDLKTDNIFVIIQFVKFLSFIVYEQFPLFTSFYYNVASLVSLKSVKFNECIDVIKKWKAYYINGKKYYIFRRNVLLIFQSDLKDVKKNLLDQKCLHIMKNLYEKNSEISKYSNDSYEKAEYIINKHSKEIISKIIKTYMNIYNIDKISNIISHMNSMNSKLKTQSYFIRSISTCLNLSKTDNFQEIENKVKELVSTKGINEKIKNKLNIEEIDEYLAAYTIICTLKKYLNISHTKDLLPSISKIIQKNRSL